MDGQAKVTSLDVLELFRSNLINFLTKSRRSLDETLDAVRSTRQWIEHEQRAHWESQLRIRRRAFDQAQAELFSAKLSSFRDNLARQQQMVRKAKAAVEEAED